MVHFTLYFFHRFSGLKLKNYTWWHYGGDLLKWLTFSPDSSRLDSDSSALIQYDLYEQLNNGTKMITPVLFKNISAYIYAMEKIQRHCLLSQKVIIAWEGCWRDNSSSIPLSQHLALPLVCLFYHNVLTSIIPMCYRDVHWSQVWYEHLTFPGSEGEKCNYVVKMMFKYRNISGSYQKG